MFLKHEVILNKKLNDKFHLIKLKSLSKFSFTPGQFVLFRIKSGVFRSYSVASIPERLPNWEIFVDITPGGPGTNYLKNLKKGQIVKTMGPSGQFIIDKHGGNYIFAATGCGVAPFLSMIPEITKNKNNKAFLLWGLRSNRDITLKKLFHSFLEKNENFDYEIVLSQPDAIWKGATGHLTIPLIEKIKNLEGDEAKIYLSGSREFVGQTTEALQKEKISTKKIYFESCY